GLVKETPTLPKDVIRTYLPGKGLEVPARRMEDDSYRLVTDLKGSDVYGNPFWLRGNLLARFTGPASFTEEQNALLKRLAKEIDPDQIFVTAPNLNPNAYGNGEVMSVSEVGKATKYFITINGHTVPVRVTPIEERGVRYDVVDGEKTYRVNFNGREWYFDKAPFPFVSKETADGVIKNIDEFESIKDPSLLSASDERGLMWNSLGRSYIKIYDHYIPLIQLYQDLDWYHLVKEDVNQPMTVLVFDPTIEKFRFPTSSEKALWEEVRSGQKKWTSKVTSMLKREKGNLPPFQTMPDSPGRGTEWNEIRDALDIEVVGEIVDRVEDDTVLMKPFTSFMPIPKPVVVNDDAFSKKAMLDWLNDQFPIKPPLPFRIYKSLDLSKAPDFLKPFLLELAAEYAKAQFYYQKTFEVCQELLTKERIAGTSQGQYLIKMFRLEGVRNSEAILLEVVKKLKYISKKGTEYLQKTADWGFENIYILSTDLVKKKGTRKYRSKYEEIVTTKGTMFLYDPECRIFIYADAFHLNPELAPTEELNVLVSNTIMHETAHIVSDAQDLTEYYRVAKGSVKSGERMLEEYKFKDSNILESDGFKSFVTQLAVYQDSLTLSRNTVWREIRRNTMLRVNLQMYEAEMLMIIIRDFAQGRDFEGKLRVTRSLNDLPLWDGLLFTFSTLINILGYDNLMMRPKLERFQEQTADNPDLTSGVTNEEDYSTAMKREKREIDTCIEKSESTTHSVSNQEIKTELIEHTAKRSLLNIVEKSNSTSQSVSNQQTGIASVQLTKQQSFLELVNSSKGESNRMSQNHIHSTNKQKKSNLQR
ncbi:MAG: hypothetical protein ACI32O_06580, partial [Enterococcus sp.]